MPKWEYKITVVNRLDRDLKLISKKIAWGHEVTFPETITKGMIGDYEVHAPAGTMTGIEFYFTLQDVAPTATDAQYGLIEVKVDMPYWKKKNTSSCTATGILEAANFSQVPDGAHDFSTTITVSKKQFPLT